MIVSVTIYWVNNFFSIILKQGLKDITFTLKKINFAQFMKINRLNPTFTKLIFEIIFLYNILWVYTFYKYNTVLIRDTCLFLFLFSKFHTINFIT
jgi:hypothetical protein